MWFYSVRVVLNRTFRTLGAERTHEKVIGIRAKATHFEKLHHIPKLTMNITANLETRRQESGQEGNLVDIQ